MIALDTHVLVRYFTRDDANQAARAEHAIDTAIERGEALFVSGIVLCELVWVLESAYKLPRAAIAAVLDRLTSARQYACENRDLIVSAIDDYRKQKGDLADYIIGRTGRAAGCTQTVTFDSALKGTSMFRII